MDEQAYLLYADNIKIELGKTQIVKGITLGIHPGEILTIIGPNGSGKSTLMKGMCRLLKPSGGQVLLNGQNIQTMKSNQLAKKIAILPQKKSVPADITVERLVQYGRVPYAGFGGRLSHEDTEVVDRMMELTGVMRFRYRQVSTLSGGEAQMAWIAMALAQQPDILFLDEPTTFLDISYQLAVLSLVHKMQEQQHLTIVMILHDLNQAAQHSDRIAVIKSGQLRGLGTPKEICCPEMFRDIFHVETQHITYGQGQNYYIPTMMTPEEQCV